MNMTGLVIAGTTKAVLHSDTQPNYTETITNTYSVQGSSTVKFDGTDPRANLVGAFGQCLPATKEMQFYGAGMGNGVFKITSTSDHNTGNTVPLGPTDVDILKTTLFDLTSGFNIPSGSESSQTTVGNDTMTTTLSWTSTVVSPPTAQTAGKSR